MNTTLTSSGLRYWMLRVLDEYANVLADFSADPVHDLRVALRRCRSMADGMMAMDPDPSWKAMKKAGKRVFQQLGALRDVQIMMEWIEKLGLKEIPQPAGANLPNAGSGIAEITTAPITQNSGEALLKDLERRETELKRDARVILEEFDRKQWRQWSKSLPARASRIRPGSLVFKHLALERWTTARQLHTIALRNRSQVAFHTLRIGIKRFRYIVENFLPAEHERWGDDLKHLQDLLGDVHDLDVLMAAANASHVLADQDTRRAWHERISVERTARIDEYRGRTTGTDSLWNMWRMGLPQGKQIQEIATRRMKLWARMLDPDFAHSERVARFSLQLYDGLKSSGLMAGTHAENNGNGAVPRSTLYIAALLHDVGKVKGKKGHHKESQKIIEKHGAPLGWEDGVIRQAAVVARFHCGALPARSHKSLRNLIADEQKAIIGLSAILRLANAFDCTHDGNIRQIRVQNSLSQDKVQKRTNGLSRKAVLAKGQPLLILAEGYSTTSSTARAVAAERLLLETVLRRPILVRTAKRS